MADPLDVDKVLAAMQNKDVKSNSDSLTGMLAQADETLGGIEKICNRLENMHVLPAIVRGIGSKYNIDVDTPLSGGMKPATDYHKIVFERLNAMSEADVGLILSGANNESTKTDNPEHNDK